MKKLHKVVEAVVEKTVGRILPQVGAEAGCSGWIAISSCCPPGQGNKCYRVCNGQTQWACTNVPYCWQ